MDWIEYTYKGQTIKVRATETQIAGNTVWIPDLRVNGAVITTAAFSHFEKKFFDTAQKAIEYAKKAGEAIAAGGAQGEIPRSIL